MPYVVDLIGQALAPGTALLVATLAERAAASRLLLECTRDMLEQAGVLPARRSILGPDHNWVVALAGAAARYWNEPGGRDRILGDLRKVIPADQAA